MQVVFYGTPDWALPCLEALIDSSHRILAVVTRPDRPRGRSRRPEPSPVGRRASEEGLPLLRPETLKDREFRRRVLELDPDVAVVVAYGRIVPRSLLAAPRLGYVNVHFSLLPRHRGAAPVQWTLLSGDTETGVTTMQMDPGLDTGPVLLRRHTPVDADETAGELGERLARMGSGLLLETLDGLAAGRLAPRPQDEAMATLAPALRAEQAWVDWSRDASEIALMVRAFQPWPVARGRCRDREFRLLRCREAPGRAGEDRPGAILGLDGEALLVACGGGTTLGLSRLQPAGRRPMDGRAAAAGRYLGAGDRFEAPERGAGRDAGERGPE
jgi:methionyl-tRNA formyltransferase